MKNRVSVSAARTNRDRAPPVDKSSAESAEKAPAPDKGGKSTVMLTPTKGKPKVCSVLCVATSCRRVFQRVSMVWFAGALHYALFAATNLAKISGGAGHS